jgi:prevent-host-death family protein
METATVGEIQKNFAEVLRKIKSGQEIIVTKRGRPVAKITALGAEQALLKSFHVRSLSVFSSVARGAAGSTLYLGEKPILHRIKSLCAVNC